MSTSLHRKELGICINAYPYVSHTLDDRHFLLCTCCNPGADHQEGDTQAVLGHRDLMVDCQHLAGRQEVHSTPAVVSHSSKMEGWEALMDRPVVVFRYFSSEREGRREADNLGAWHDTGHWNHRSGPAG